MTLKGTFKALNVAVLVGIILLMRVGLYALQNDQLWLGLAVLAGLALLLSRGRILRLFWAELMAGLYHLTHRNYAESKLHSERFLAQLQATPWLGKLIWLGTTSYSHNAEALARNNLGAAMLKLNEIEPAREQFARAIELDPLCPLPYRNMGVLVLNSATFTEAMPWFEKATALGLEKGWTDRVTVGSQGRYAARAVGGRDAVQLPRPRFGGAFRIDILNDDVTPIEFVVSSLEQVFGLTGAQAIRITLAVDRDGWAGCAGFETQAAAQEKADQLRALARAGGFPLCCHVVAVRPVLW